MSFPSGNNDFVYMSKAEEIRMRHCKGCKYMGVAASSGCCNYYLETGLRRPCKFGTKCPVKKLRPGFKLPSNYDAWCEEWDRKIAAKKEETERRQREREAAIRALMTEAEDLRRDELDRLEQSRSDADKKGDTFTYRIPRKINHQTAPCSNLRGPRVSWDADYAFSLYISGYYIVDISEIVGVDLSKLNNYIQKYGWRDYPERNTSFKRADIPAERERYRKWKAQKSADKKQSV